MWSQIASIRGLKRLNTIFSFHQESINGPFSICDPNACHWRRVIAFQKETIIDFSEVRKCPQVLLEQMKLCMTSSLLGLISDLWTGNNKDPDVIETYEWSKKNKKRLEKKNLQNYIYSILGTHEWGCMVPFLSFCHSHSFTCHIPRTVLSVSHWYSLTQGWRNGQCSFHLIRLLYGSAVCVWMFLCASVCMCMAWWTEAVSRY